MNFVNWYELKDIFVDANMTLAEYCGQYAAVQTNWVYTIAALLGIVVLAVKGNKKWYWYIFLSIVAVMSFTSVGMHTANYGEFQRGVLTTKLVASYVDMTFTELMAWSGVCCFVMEFYSDSKKRRNVFLSLETILAVAVIAILTYEVFCSARQTAVFCSRGRCHGRQSRRFIKGRNRLLPHGAAAALHFVCKFYEDADCSKTASGSGCYYFPCCVHNHLSLGR